MPECDGRYFINITAAHAIAAQRETDKTRIDKQIKELERLS